MNDICIKSALCVCATYPSLPASNEMVNSLPSTPEQYSPTTPHHYSQVPASKQDFMMTSSAPTDYENSHVNVITHISNHQPLSLLPPQLRKWWGKNM